jgi:hypothetical protein
MTDMATFDAPVPSDGATLVDAFSTIRSSSGSFCGFADFGGTDETKKKKEKNVDQIEITVGDALTTKSRKKYLCS